MVGCGRIPRRARRPPEVKRPGQQDVFVRRYDGAERMAGVTTIYGVRWMSCGGRVMVGLGGDGISDQENLGP